MTEEARPGGSGIRMKSIDWKVIMPGVANFVRATWCHRTSVSMECPSIVRVHVSSVAKPLQPRHQCSLPSAPPHNNNKKKEPLIPEALIPTQSSPSNDRRSPTQVSRRKTRAFLERIRSEPPEKARKKRAKSGSLQEGSYATRLIQETRC